MFVGKHELLEDGDRLPASAASIALHGMDRLLSAPDAAAFTTIMKFEFSFAVRTGGGKGEIFVVLWYDSQCSGGPPVRSCLGGEVVRGTLLSL